MDESLRRRLESLNRQPLPAAKPGGVAVASQQRPAGESSRESVIRSPGSLLGRGCEVANPAGNHWRIVLPVDALWANGQQLVDARCDILRQQSQTARPNRSRLAAELHTFVQSFPEGALFLDLETCGLTGAALFLVGLLRHIDDMLCVELLLARNYAEEKAVLVSLWRLAAQHNVLVTFNGKSFDWPMVHDRSNRYLLGRPTESERAERPVANDDVRVILDRQDARPELLHVDILQHARRRWKKQLPNCKLQTLEQFICRRRREGDIPGAQIPAAYQRYVQSKRTDEMESILYHNALDLITLLDLTMRLA